MTRYIVSICHKACIYTLKQFEKKKNIIKISRFKSWFRKNDIGLLYIKGTDLTYPNADAKPKKKMLWPNLSGCREQVNDATSYVDASNVYGSNEKTARSLRSFKNGNVT
jgi:hypothetical protein